MPRTEDHGSASSIRQKVYEAWKNHKPCQFYSSGMYRGIHGYIVSIKNGTVVVQGETEEGVKVEHIFRLSDVKRVTVFDE